ncbi:unnamed protein product [Triticum turgidum subsp. durum]|uniref:Uncharacterized protein n=1 Tax=Triticum turgidum subsp. durum TaxID=4567 RepID=A0A9R0WPB9_TRITD|nr:unnamed protein product [Triticum turgidum subsp. durum]
MTGGPFCSGMIFFEVGPMKFVLAPYNGSLPQLTYNPYSWSKTASITLLDSPVGTGFSYARDVKGYHDIGDFSFSMHVVIFLNKGYVVGNPVTGSDYDDNFRVPYAHGVGIISDQLYEAAILNCKGSYIRPTNKMCVRVLNTFQNLVSEIDVPQILGVNCIRGMLTHKFLSEEYTQLSDPSPEQPTIDCFSYRYYLCNIWANDDSTREALG